MARLRVAVRGNCLHSWKYIEQAIVDRQQGVILQLEVGG